MDLTAKLPDEVLIEVLHHLPSLRDKLRVESVSRRFEQCLFDLMSARPLSLELDIWYNGAKRSLNGYKVPEHRVFELFSAVRSLAKKAKFCRICLNLGSKEQLEWILAALINSNNGCLDKVTTLRISFVLSDATHSLLQEAIAKCTKLTVVDLDFSIRPVDGDPHLDASCPMDLAVVLADKALTQLSIRLEDYALQVSKVFQSLKPNTLKKMRLKLRDEMTLDIGALVNDLRNGGWMAVEEIEFRFSGLNLQMADLFSSLTQLPNLRECNISLHGIEPENQLVDALKSLFANRRHKIRAYTHDYINGVTGCQMVELIRQVQIVHPDLQVGFHFEMLGPMLILTLGKVTFEYNFAGLFVVPRCENVECAQCVLFKPTVIGLLAARANERVRDMQQDVYLANCRLDRCTIGSVEQDLNHSSGPSRWVAWSTELNETYDLATVTFETDREGGDQFQITVDCGHCLTNSCVGCTIV